jgi:hypothetical protein
MIFTLYALMSDDAPPISNESLAEGLSTHLRNEAGFFMQFEQLPFSPNKTLALRWYSWLVRVSYEEGEEVRDDSVEIQKRTGSTSGMDVSHIERRIRLVFGDDDAKEYTNQLIYLIDFLREIPGVVIFDPQQNDFIK